MGNIGYAVTFISKTGEQFNDLRVKPDENPVLLDLPTVLGKNEVPDWLTDLLWTEKGVTVEQVQQVQVQNIFTERPQWVAHQHPTEEAVDEAVDAQIEPIDAADDPGEEVEDPGEEQTVEEGSVEQESQQYGPKLIIRTRDHSSWGSSLDSFIRVVDVLHGKNDV